MFQFNFKLSNIWKILQILLSQQNSHATQWKKLKTNKTLITTLYKLPS